MDGTKLKLVKGKMKFWGFAGESKNWQIIFLKKIVSGISFVFILPYSANHIDSLTTLTKVMFFEFDALTEFHKC